jgi:fumarylacetoacetate (FAA) hydrolase
MHFSFFELVEHICRTRALTAGTIVGSGTISNENPASGSSCIVERRTLETLADGAPKTPYMTFGDSIEISMVDAAGTNLFGTISQTVVKSDR